MNKGNLITILLVLCLTSLPAIAGPLHEAAKSGDVAQIRTLLNQGADINARVENGYTPLHWAARYGHIEAVRVLLKAGALINARDEKERTPLHYAAGYGHVEAVRVLLKAGANINAQSEDGYTQESINVREIANNLEYGTPSLKGYTPLHGAVEYGHVEAIRVLLKAGADVHAQGQNGFTPLHVAAAKGHVEAVRALLKAGADVNSDKNFECSPVDYARMSMNDTESSVAPFKETIKVLQAAGGRAGC